MHTRQLIESFGIGPKSKLLELKNGYETEAMKNQHPRNFQAVSEMGKMWLNVLYQVRLCATNSTNSCKTNRLLYISLKRSKNLYKKTDVTAAQLKGTLKMTYHLMKGMVDLAEGVRPHGLNCYAQSDCSARKKMLPDNVFKILTKRFERATIIQRRTIESSFSHNVFIPSYEVYGHVLLFLDRYVEAKHMFEESLLENNIGRTISLLGLARSHAMLGKKKQAMFFYQYLKDQYRHAAEDNPVVKEAQSYLKTKRNLVEWFWPYFSP